MLDDLKIALVCDWLTVYGGAERVMYELHQLFPKAPIYTPLYNAKRCSVFKDADVRESAFGKIPGARRFHRLFLPFMPGYFERLDLSEYDLVISSSHSAAKGIITKTETLHVSYCHSPMRYVWDHCHSYQKNDRKFSPFKLLYLPILHKIRMWDRLAAERVDRFIANAHYIKNRISKYYGKDSVVIHPPVDLEKFYVSQGGRNFYLAIGRLIPNKKFDLVVQAFNELGYPLKIIGDGPEENHLKRIAKSNVEFLGRASDEILSDCYRGAKALIFPQLEDFGIVPLEAIASGTPVLAYGRGGALETVQKGKSGLFFEEQTIEALIQTVHEFEKKSWDPEKVAATVQHFGSARFKSEFRHFLEKAWKEHRKMLA